MRLLSVRMVNKYSVSIWSPHILVYAVRVYLPVYAWSMAPVFKCNVEPMASHGPNTSAQIRFLHRSLIQLAMAT